MRRKKSERGAGAAALVGAATDRPTNWPGGDEPSIAVAEDLDRLSPDLLRRRWRSVMGRPAPASLLRQLMIRILSWREQVARVGDVDSKTLAALAAALNAANGSDAALSAAPAPRAPRPGSILAREHGGVLHRVMVLDRGYAWNGRTFAVKVLT